MKSKFLWVYFHRWICDFDLHILPQCTSLFIFLF